MRASRVFGVLGCALLVFAGGCGGGSGGESSGSVAGLKAAAPGAEATTASTQGPAAVASPAIAAAQPAANGNAPVVIEPKVSQGSNQDIDPFRTRPTGSTVTPGQVTLEPMAANAKGQSIQKAEAAALGFPAQIGVAREVSDTATPQKISSAMGWSASAGGGRVSALRFRSPGALGVRVGLLVKGLPFGSVVRFYADGSDKIFEIPGQEIVTSIQRNLDAGETGDAAHTYWSPNLGGEAITVEFEVPPGISTDAVQVAIPSLSHVFVDVSKLDSITKIGQAGSCNLDVTCNSSYSETSRSVAIADFIKDGANYVCTGTLLNDRMSSGIPYFLSANHCIPTQTVASSLYTRWFFRSTSCNSTQLNPGVVVMTTGATLLYATTDTDTSFMRLNSAPPAGAIYAGSSPYSLDPASRVGGIHHPLGDMQKYSDGVATGTAACTPDGYCGASVSSAAKFWRVSWLAGTTEGGSSGSGLFTRMNGKDYLTGQLFGGSASCTNPGGTDYYGRFDVAYVAKLWQWLNNSSTTVKSPIYRFYNTRSRAHFYTSDTTERDNVIAKFPEYSYDGGAFYAYSGPASGTSPVHRFFNRQTGAHFYTINESERQYVASNFSSFQYDGVAWYANTSQAGTSAAMYRFYNSKTSTHFYTISAAERDYVARNFSPEFNFEGIGYYAWTAP